ncbi:response regulator transcription factor [Novosphingobium sp.]|uniref:response regulator transcription factor n=1 Tax=Novosphingobium sp. TaxID=1874826 RepID=UPI0025FE293C|nr:response regulator transcription factor [Novosphingobium sp.]
MRVLLIEDDPQTAEAISAWLERDQIAVDWVNSGETGLHQAGNANIDVILLDWMLPGMSGIDVVARIRGAGIEKPVLMLSALGRAEHRVEGLDRGADDYLAKPFEPNELVARVRALHRRNTVQSRQPVLIHGDIELHVRARTAHRGGKHLGLSPKEFELLKYLMENAGEIVTREMLLLNVWNLSFDPQTNVIDVNLVRLRRKLEDGFSGTCLENVRGRGYRLVVPEAQSLP